MTLIRKSCSLSPWLEQLLANPPQHGDGVHQWLFMVARHLHRHMGEEEMFRCLQAAVEGCGRPVPVREVTEAIRNSWPVAWRPGAGNGNPERPTAERWPALNAEARQWVIEDISLGLVDLWEASPHRMDEGRPDAEEFVDCLFPENPLLCVGKSSADFVTAPREKLRGGLASCSLIVPSPMSKPKGRRKSDGQLSAHTLENTGPRQFLVVEFDQGSVDDQAALLWHLNEIGPLTLALHSGGKSLHGWFPCVGEPEQNLRSFMEYAVSLGADRATWTRAQFVRLPEGRRGSQRRQKVYFFNPNALAEL